MHSISSVSAGSNVFNPKEDTYRQSKVLALLLSKSLLPVEKDDPLGERPSHRLTNPESPTQRALPPSTLTVTVLSSAGLELASKLAELEEVRAS